MRLTLEPLYVAEHTGSTLLKVDQLTLVRNHVRKQIKAHEISVDGEMPSEFEVEVAWQDGDVDMLVFDKNAGFPIEPVVDWYGDWLRDMRNS